MFFSFVFIFSDSLFVKLFGHPLPYVMLDLGLVDGDADQCR